MTATGLAARLLGAALLTTALAGVSACGSGTATPDACAPNAPMVCPSPAPGYAAEVAPVVTRRCRPCHTAGGVEASAPLDTYDQVHARRDEILVRVNSCLMPPANQPQLSEAERTQLLAWLVCGAPND